MSVGGHSRVTREFDGGGVDAEEDVSPLDGGGLGGRSYPQQ